MGDVVLFVENKQSACVISDCRICHEEEFQSSKALEVPCSCSGTVKVNQNSSLFSGFVLFLLLNIFLIIIFDNCFGFCSLPIEIAYKGGVTRKEIQFVKFVFRYMNVTYLRAFFAFICYKLTTMKIV